MCSPSFYFVFSLLTIRHDVQGWIPSSQTVLPSLLVNPSLLLHPRPTNRVLLPSILFLTFISSLTFRRNMPGWIPSSLFLFIYHYYFMPVLQTLLSLPQHPSLHSLFSSPPSLRRDMAPSRAAGAGWRMYVKHERSVLSALTCICSRPASWWACCVCPLARTTPIIVHLRGDKNNDRSMATGVS